MNEIHKSRKAIALGDFDGMHLAHQRVVTGGEDVVIYCVNNKFSLLQKSVFQKRYPNAVFADFEKIKELSGENFIKEIILKEFMAKMVLCGFNFTFGKNASWTAVDMRNYCEKKDVWVRILEHLDHDGLPISSTRIRNALKNGEIEKANKMLGYNFCFEAEVIDGDKRGRTINFPTINQNIPEGLIIPKFGVYESRTIIGSTVYKSFTNVGERPSFKVDKPLAETHIFDYNGDLYGESVLVEFVRYIRGEKFFNSVEELKSQLENDKSSIV